MIYKQASAIFKWAPKKLHAEVPSETGTFFTFAVSA